MKPTRRPARHVIKSVVAGVAGGLVASWAMAHFAAEWSRVVDGVEPESSGGRHDARDWQERTEDQNATELVAERAAEAVLQRRLTEQELGVAAPLVHYGFGAAMGAIYGGLAEFVAVGPLTGAAYGTLIWIVGDEMAVPALKLSGAPRSYTPDAHGQAFAAHLVYGVTTDLVRRLFRAIV